MIPMAASLGFGVVVATTISLFLVPSAYLILEDVKQVLRSVKREGGQRGRSG